MTEIIKLQANAKINLTLGITGKRTDGYHEIDTIMQSIGIYDIVKIKKDSRISVKCSETDICGESNIAYKAAEIFFKKTGINAGVEIDIEKSIPTAAGLGGGSSDAAAVLIGLNHIFETNLSDDELLFMALYLGADVPFFITGGTVHATGIGEVLSKQPDLENGYFLLVKTDAKPSTAEMYRRLDSSNIFLPDTDKALKAIKNGDLLMLSGCLTNSFAALWNDCKAKDRLEKTDAIGVSLSGSGPVWFGIYNEYNKAYMAFKELKSEKVSCWLTKPENFSIKIV